jgi:hypothetical protein
MKRSKLDCTHLAAIPATQLRRNTDPEPSWADRSKECRSKAGYWHSKCCAKMSMRCTRISERGRPLSSNRSSVLPFGVPPWPMSRRGAWLGASTLGPTRTLMVTRFKPVSGSARRTARSTTTCRCGGVRGAAETGLVQWLSDHEVSTMLSSLSSAQHRARARCRLHRCLLQVWCEATSSHADRRARHLSLRQWGPGS